MGRRWPAPFHLARKTGYPAAQRRIALSRRSADESEALEIDDLWRDYKATQDSSLRERLVAHYLPMVRNLAVGVLRKLPSGSELDDLVADGNMGLVRAIESFDPARGFKFQTYAVPVVRGAIFNGIRRLDWVPERTRTKARALQQAKERLQASSGEEPSEEQLAEELKISTEEVYDLIASLSTAYLLSLDQPLGNTEEGETAYYDVVQDEAEDPFMEIEFAEERATLKGALARLDEREQAIVTMHYFEGITFEAISRTLGVSKQRISQLHSRAVRMLREFIGDQSVSPEALQGFTYEA